MYAISLLFMVISCVSRPDMPENDRTRADSLLISCFDSIYLSPADMEQRFHRAQGSMSDSGAICKLELFAAYCAYLQGRADEAEAVNDRVLDYCRRHAGEDALEAVCWNHRYAMLQAMNQGDSAIACLHHAYDALYRSDDRRELENVCINLADLYRQKGNLADAVRYYRKAMWVADSLGSERVKFSIYVGLAQVYADLHNFPMAHRYFDMAGKVPEQRLAYEDYLFENSKGNCYYFEERYQEALTCFRRAYEVTCRFRQPSMEALVEANIGEVFTLLGRYDSAHRYLDKSYAYFLSDTTANEEVVFYVNSLMAALALREGDLAKADRYLKRPYNPLRIGPSYTYLHNKRFMEYYAQRGDYRRAYAYRKAVEQYDDSMRNLRYTNSIAEIDYRYRQDTTLLRRDVQIATNRALLSRQRNINFGVAALLAITLLGGTLAMLHVRRKNEREYEQQRAIVTELRMENVRNRLSPHYVFNVINTLMPTFSQYPDLSNLLQRFVTVLRNNLLSGERMDVSLEREIEQVKDYVALHHDTHPGAARTEWHIDPQTDMAMLVPSMCLQIPVENALKHAFDDDSPDNRICIEIRHRDRGIDIRVRDNGCGYDPGRQSAHASGSTGNGLKLLFRTIGLLNGRNAEKITFDIDNLSDGKGTEVCIFIPYNYHY